MKTLASLLFLAFTLSLQAGTMTWNGTSRKTEQPSIWLLSTNGTAAAPGVAFFQDQDTGMYRSATNAIGFATAGTGRWIITAAGDFIPVADGAYSIGDGTTDPLHINFTGNLVNGATSVSGSDLAFLKALVARTLTIAGTAAEITSSAGAQDLSGNRTWTLSLPSALTFTGKTVTGGTFASITLSGTPVYPDGTIALADMANLATQRVIGRNTGSTGVPEAVTAAQILSWLGTAAQGDIIYFNGTTWTYLVAGTAGQFLETQGAGANVRWGTPAGSGDVLGAASSTDNAVARFNGTGGKTIQNSGVIVDDSDNITIPGTATVGSAAGGSITGSNGTLTIAGTGDGQDESFAVDLNTTANEAGFSSGSGMASWNFGTSWVFKLGTVEIGHATDSTLSRSAAGILAVEGNVLFAANTKADIVEAGFFAADAGANDTYTATLSPAITAYVTGARYRFKANTANTGAATLNLNGLGAKTIKKAAGGITTDLADNDIRAGQWCDLVYDGTNLQLQSLLGNAPAGSGTVTSVGWTGGIVSVANPTTTPAFTIAGTSGGIPYFSSGTAWASSAALAANAIVVGGGAGAAPATVTTGAGNLTALALAANATGGFVTDNGTATLSGKTMAAGSNAFTDWPVEYPVAISDEATALTTGTAKVKFRMPFAFTLTSVRASVGTAPTGSTIIIDVNEGGSTVFTTNLTIDATESTSTSAATPAVIGGAGPAIADDAEITVDIDQIGSSVAGAGLKITLIGTRTI